MTQLVTRQEDFVRDCLRSSPLHMLVLHAAKDISSSLWLGGGAIRNLVWDRITGQSTPIEDFDLVFFSRDASDAVEDRRLSAKIAGSIGAAVAISAHNQARMHLRNREPSRASLFDAILNWPETATCIAAQIDRDNSLNLMAPHGYDDLLMLVVRPTPFHAENPAAYVRRKRDKNWISHWPQLRVS